MLLKWVNKVSYLTQIFFTQEMILLRTPKLVVYSAQWHRLNLFLYLYVEVFKIFVSVFDLKFKAGMAWTRKPIKYCQSCRKPQKPWPFPNKVPCKYTSHSLYWVRFFLYSYPVKAHYLFISNNVFIFSYIPNLYDVSSQMGNHEMVLKG